MGKASLGLSTFINIHGFKVQSDPMTVNGLWESLHYFHIWSHTGDKPYECKHRGKAFTVASTCKIVKIDTREQPLERKECEKSFTSKSWLNTLKHRRDWRLMYVIRVKRSVIPGISKNKTTHVRGKLWIWGMWKGLQVSRWICERTH